MQYLLSVGKLWEDRGFQLSINLTKVISRMKYVSFAAILISFLVVEAAQSLTCEQSFERSAPVTIDSLTFEAEEVIYKSRDMKRIIESLRSFDGILTSQKFKWRSRLLFDPLLDSFGLIDESLEDIVQIRKRTLPMIDRTAAIQDQDRVRQRRALKEIDTALLFDLMAEDYVSFTTQVDSLIYRISNQRLRNEAAWSLTLLRKDLETINLILEDYIRFLYRVVLKAEPSETISTRGMISEIAIGLDDFENEQTPVNFLVFQDSDQLALIGFRQQINRILEKMGVL